MCGAAKVQNVVYFGSSGESCKGLWVWSESQQKPYVTLK